MRNILHSFMLILLCGSVACTREPRQAAHVVNTGDDQPVYFTVRTPARSSGTQTPGTTQENFINSLWVLVFRADNSNETYEYKAMASELLDGATDNIKTFRLKVLKKDYRQRFVVIANAGNSITTIDETYIGMEKEALLEQITFSNSQKWHATGSSFTPIPMWGESESVIIDNSTIQVPVIPVTRMVARIDVMLDEDLPDGTFTLSSLHLYNTHTNGRVTPDRTNSWNAVDWKASNVSMPSSASKVRGPHDIDAVASTPPHLPSAYVFESPAVEVDDWKNATCAVIGGYYQKDGSPTYYRVDFFNKDDDGKNISYKDLLRNHLYAINIVSIDGSGYGTPDEAFESKSENMTVIVKEWDEGDLSNIVFNGQYMLGVDPGSFDLPKYANDGLSLTVTTDYPKGWTPSVDPTQYPWLKIVDWNFSGINKMDPLKFSVDEYPSGSEPRTGYIVITAGRLKYSVRVIQYPSEGYSLKLVDDQGNEIDELVFHCGQDNSVTEQQYTVKWTPAAESVHVMSYKVGDHAFGAGVIDDPASDSELAVQTRYRILPGNMTTTETHPTNGDPFKEKTTRLNYILGSGSDILAKGITLRQIHYELLDDVEASYNMGGTYSFTIRTNADWTATLTSNQSGSITQYDTSGTANTAGTQYSFSLADHNGSSGPLESVITFRLTCHDGSYVYRTVKIVAVPPQTAYDEVGSNCYLLEPGGDGVRIPVSWANKSDFPSRIGANTQLTAKLIWTDHPAGMGSSAAVSRFNIVGQGSSAKLEVYPGSSSGNAVVGVFESGSDKCLWSWHIWVADYDPASSAITYGGKTWMKWNLGATTDQRGSEYGYGMLYQWGRKDPFPRNAYRSAGAIPIYDASGEDTQITFTVVGQVANLDNAISYPTIYYTGGKASSKDWYSTQNRDDNLWGNSGPKAAYDPCPPGWRVPTGEAFADFGYSHRWDTTYWDLYFTDWEGANLSGNWVAAGYIEPENGNYIFLDSGAAQGRYWTANPLGLQPRALGLNGNNSPDKSATAFRATGNSIRCVKE